MELCDQSSHCDMDQLFGCHVWKPGGLNTQRCSSIFTLSYFISYFHTATPCAHIHTIYPRALSQHSFARIIVKHHHSIIYQMYILSKKVGSSWDSPKMCYLLDSNSSLDQMPKCKPNDKDSGWCKGKAFETHSKAYQGTRNFIWPPRKKRKLSVCNPQFITELYGHRLKMKSSDGKYIRKEKWKN